MSEEKKSFWARIFSSQPGSEREAKVLEYIVHRCHEGVNLEDAVEEEYVRRNATRAQIDDVLRDPRLIQSARESLNEAFTSGELDPQNRSKE